MATRVNSQSPNDKFLSEKQELLSFTPRVATLVKGQQFETDEIVISSIQFAVNTRSLDIEDVESYQQKLKTIFKCPHPPPLQTQLKQLISTIDDKLINFYTEKIQELSLAIHHVEHPLDDVDLLGKIVSGIDKIKSHIENIQEPKKKMLTHEKFDSVKKLLQHKFDDLNEKYRIKPNDDDDDDDDDDDEDGIVMMMTTMMTRYRIIESRSVSY